MEYDNTRYLVYKLFQSKIIWGIQKGETRFMYKGKNKSKKSIM